ncbi:hypothetical protein [Lysobacter brunescens]|uniref:Uncharacterized protein n=1 Tax=Lysobacter brunescens TaxID=262323 RepID=A0ABW2YGV6_9GAMM
MNIRLPMQCLRYASVAALTTAAWWFHADLSAPDACLDMGGAFDYARWLCDIEGIEAHAYIDTPITALPSFPVFATCLVAYVAMRMRPVRARRGAPGR